MISAGKLNDRLTFTHPPTTKNSYNEPTGPWTTYYNCWGSITPVKGSQEYQTDVFTAASTYNVAIRYSRPQTFATGDHILLRDGTVLRIEAVLRMDSRSNQICFMCLVINETS